MNSKKITRKFVFTVEGETEKLYFDWLMDTINNSGRAFCNVSIVSKVEKDPLKYAKRISQKVTPRVSHICDIESNDSCYQERFQNILSQMKAAKTQRGIEYALGYSNYTFELWMILHKLECNGAITDRSQYLRFINKAYDENFENLDKYKVESNFKRCLSRLSLDDVISAISRSRHIMNCKASMGEIPIQYKGFKYYRENPALSIWEEVAKILVDCGVLKKEKTKKF